MLEVDHLGAMTRQILKLMENLIQFTFLSLLEINKGLLPDCFVEILQFCLNEIRTIGKEIPNILHPGRSIEDH